MMAAAVSMLPAIALLMVVGLVLPAYVTLGNPGVTLLPDTWLAWAGTLAAAAAAIVLLLYILRRLAPRVRIWLDALTCGLLAAVTVNHVFIFDLLLSPRLHGADPGLTLSPPRAIGSVVLSLVVLLGVAWFASRSARRRGGVALASLLACLGTLIPQAMLHHHNPLRHAQTQKIAPDFFHLSGKRNIIHLLPDGLQSDAVAEVIEQRPDLRERLAGFQFFPNHAGSYPFTAPSLTALLTGRPHDLASGYFLADVDRDFRENSVTSALGRDGYRVHFTGLGPAYCGSDAASCVIASFGSLEAPRPGDDYSIDMLNLGFHLDLSLLRLAPAGLARRIHANGSWIVSRWVRHRLGLSRVPHPLVEDWINRFEVDPEGPPAYFFYHYIGTHRPLRWDSACTRFVESSVTRDALIAQTICVLDGIARLTERLRELGVEDQTSILVSSDHGAGIPAKSRPHEWLLALGQATLMVKAAGDRAPFRMSPAPTTLTDVPGIARAFALGEPWQSPPADRPRRFYWINPAWFSQNQRTPIATDIYALPQDPSQLHAWRLVEMLRPERAPTSLGEFSTDDMTRFRHAGYAHPGSMRVENGAWTYRRLDVVLSAQAAANALRASVRPTQADTRLEILLNGESIDAGRPLPVEGSGQNWIDLALCVEAGRIVAGNNHVSLLVSGEGRAFVRDLALVAEATCDRPPADGDNDRSRPVDRSAADSAPSISRN